MIKIAFKFKDDKPLVNWLAVINQTKRELKLDSLEGIMLNATITRLRQPKTYSQLKYFHSDGVLGRIIQGCIDSGFNLPVTMEGKKEWVKNEIKLHPEIRFVEIHESANGDKTVLPKSFSGASKEVLSQIIEWALMYFGQNMGIEFESVQDYKKRLGLK